MPAPADAAGAVTADGCDAVRGAAVRERARERRKARQEDRRQHRQAERDRKAAVLQDRRRAGEERLAREAEEARRSLAARAAELAEAAGGSVPDCFASVPDPRSRRGRRHSLPSILTLVVMAMLHGKTTLADITAWIAHAGQDALAAAGARADQGGRRTAPCGRTVTRVLGRLGAQALADAVAGYLAAAVPAGPAAFPVSGPVPQPSLHCDGKEVRGAARGGGTVPFLLSAEAGGIVLAEREIGAKTNEIPEIGPMLTGLGERFPLAGWVITADALHTQRKLARLVCEDLLAHYVLTVKDNQGSLIAALERLNWPRARRHVTRGRGHGRAETREHLIIDAPAGIRDLFPHAAQAARVTRTRTRTTSIREGRQRIPAQETGTQAVYLITSLTRREAAPAHIAAYARGHWHIENKIHYVRDVTFREDASKTHAGSRPRVLATLRNLVIGLIRQHGLDGIAPAIRATEYDPALLNALLRLTDHQ